MNPAHHLPSAHEAKPLRTAKAPGGKLGLCGPNQLSAWRVVRAICERAKAGPVTSPHDLAIGDLARGLRERPDRRSEGAAPGAGGVNPEPSDRERSGRKRAADRERTGSAGGFSGGESPTDGQWQTAFAVVARARLASVPKESHPRKEPETRTGSGRGADRSGQSVEVGTPRLFSPPAPGAADVVWHGAKLRRAGYPAAWETAFQSGPAPGPAGSWGLAAGTRDRTTGFGLDGLPSVRVGPNSQNDTREAEGRPAPTRQQTHRPDTTKPQHTEKPCH